MLFFALRHGKAGEGFPDSVRELTPRGRRDVAMVVSHRADDLSVLEKVVHSPLVRAGQTAQIALENLTIRPGVVESDLITPDSDVEEFCDYLAGESEVQMICTHNPFVADLVSYLTGKSISMPTASLAALEFDTPAAGRARLMWLDTP